MTHDQREIHRKKRILEYAERNREHQQDLPILRARTTRWCMDRGSEVVNGTRTREKCGRWATLVG